MRRTYVYSLIVFIVASFILSGLVSAGEKYCDYCGMKKSMYGYSWMIIHYEEDSMKEVCSVHCGCIDMALHPGKKLSKITVGDYVTHKQIDANKAYWVIGGDKLGVMTSNAKWAFKTKSSADRFMRDHGGRPATFNEVLKASFEDMYEDIMMIQRNRHIMRLLRPKSKN